jgi:hypothetical protein
VEGRGLWEEETEKGKLRILAGRTAERWTHGVGDGVDALDSLVKGTLGADVLDEDVRERLALKLLLDVLALKSQPQNSQKVGGGRQPTEVAVDGQTDLGRSSAAHTFESDRTVPTTLKPAFRNESTTWMPRKPEAPVTRTWQQERGGDVVSEAPFRDTSRARAVEGARRHRQYLGSRGESGRHYQDGRRGDGFEGRGDGDGVREQETVCDDWPAGLCRK